MNRKGWHQSRAEDPGEEWRGGLSSDCVFQLCESCVLAVHSCRNSLFYEAKGRDTSVYSSCESTQAHTCPIQGWLYITSQWNPHQHSEYEARPYFCWLELSGMKMFTAQLLYWLIIIQCQSAYPSVLFHMLQIIHPRRLPDENSVFINLAQWLNYLPSIKCLKWWKIGYSSPAMAFCTLRKAVIAATQLSDIPTGPTICTLQNLHILI